MNLIGDKILVYGDPHLNSNNPSSRIDDYPSACLGKLEQIKNIALEERCSLVICLGDVFHKREQSLTFLNRVIKTMKSFKDAGIYHTTISGNHDLSYERLDTLITHPLGLLLESEVLHELNSIKLTTSHGYNVRIDGYHFPNDIKPNPRDTYLSVCIAHRFYNTEDIRSIHTKDIVEADYDITLLGHDHVRYEPEKVGKRLVLRPGSMTRGTSHIYNLQRDIAVELITFNLTEGTPSYEVESKLLNIKPSNEVFSQTVFNKGQSLSAIVTDLHEQVNELVSQMDASTYDSTVYDLLDAFPELEPSVKKTVEVFLGRKGVFRETTQLERPL